MLRKDFSTLNTCIVGGLVAKLCLALATLWTVACQVPLSMRFSKQEYWSGLPFPSPGYLLNSGMEPGYTALQANCLPTELRGKRDHPNAKK